MSPATKALLVFAGCVLAAGAADPARDLAGAFRTPPDSAKPWVFWLWTEYGTKDGITKDLEMLKRQGVGGLLFAEGGPDQLSPAWRDNYRYLVREAARLGFDFNANIANGFGTGGPWTTPEMAAKKLVYTEIQVDGPQSAERMLPQPPVLGGYYRDAAVIAFRERDKRPVTPFSVTASSTLGGYVGEWNFPARDVIDRDPETFWRAADTAGPTREKPAWLELRYPEPLAATGLYVAPAAGGGPRECELEASDDGRTFRTVTNFTMEKGQARRLSIPGTTARHFRLLMRSAYVPDIEVAEVWLLRAGDEPYVRPGLKWWAFKSGNRSFWDYPKQGPAALDEEYPGEAFDLHAGDVIDLTAKMDAQGRLHWDAPAGRWTVLRFGQTLQGTPPRSSSGGYELDLYKDSSADFTFEKMANLILEDSGPLVGKTLTGLHIDSYEYGVSEHGQLPTWTERFPEEFRTRRGYDLLAYMPVLAGRIVDSRQLSDRFLWDYRRTMADLYTGFYARLRKLAHQRKVETASENGYGTYPFPHIDGLQAFGAGDNPQGEFWTATDIMSQHFHFCDSVRTAASAAHIYGKQKVQAEAFSTWLRPYETYPGVMKRYGDQAFAAGLQQCVIFCSTHQKDGDVPGIGTGGYEIINRHVTWQKQSKAFFDYLARCQYLLEQGRFVADALYFRGEGSTTFVPAKQFLKPPLPAGYDFDGLDAEVLLNKLSVKSGRLVLPSGMSYRVLVLPEKPELSAPVLRKIRELIEAGATVLGERPLGAPGLAGYPRSDNEVKNLVGEMWGPEAVPSGERRLGRGRLVWGKDAGALLAEMHMAPDFEVKGAASGSQFEFVHRTAGDAEIYFVANGQDAVAEVEPIFRVAGKQPEIWDPVSGRNWNATDFRQENGRTAVPMRFAPYQSFFVVFRKAASAPRTTRPNFPVFSGAVEVRGPWTVRFDPKWGGPESVVFENLTDWTKRPEDGIRFYSGTATYRTTFDMPAEFQRGSCYMLDLGDLKDLAEVRLNGKDLGVLWTKPFAVDATGLLKASGNILEIDIVNLWTNRLIGDAGLPADKRFTKSDVLSKFKKGDRLLESGLLGPVQLKLVAK